MGEKSLEKKSYDIKQIQEIIPHRYPFLFIDKIEEVIPGKSAIGIKNITMNEYFFQGHFPKEPVLPGVIIIEALAQVGAVALLDTDDFRGKTAYFGGIKNARFRRKVVPGDTLKLKVEIIKMRGPMGIGKAIATVNGEVACEAELTFAVGD
ncbi:3-hydroxyacyl-ACP dehydratase FabZ [Clostridium argentinense]|nr:beta-hydroxyacyl-ACP dehydratase [Clostridium argentinense]NFF39189.1 3-hydroxyacyl-ACP dehydratase FabZ [Clostridium argentinense]NFP49601.1 3-hydroxyacyl-ACP dehydratase FabZ [Clostridium argentinense]NFP72304.1 3-hydroxyacyl-ACP dehydratase FabZ [Clostridium argentinense]NFP76475.1 3-hydroxyacyl-ACP dehydratase FabZ [Clostridium argentinense]